MFLKLHIQSSLNTVSSYLKYIPNQTLSDQPPTSPLRLLNHPPRWSPCFCHCCPMVCSPHDSKTNTILILMLAYHIIIQNSSKFVHFTQNKSQVLSMAEDPFMVFSLLPIQHFFCGLSTNLENFLP